MISQSPVDSTTRLQSPAGSLGRQGPSRQDRLATGNQLDDLLFGRPEAFDRLCPTAPVRLATRGQSRPDECLPSTPDGLAETVEYSVSYEHAAIACSDCLVERRDDRSCSSPPAGCRSARRPDRRTRFAVSPASLLSTTRFVIEFQVSVEPRILIRRERNWKLCESGC